MGVIQGFYRRLYRGLYRDYIGKGNGNYYLGTEYLGLGLRVSCPHLGFGADF